ncbi:MAG: hypothetical protein DYG89_30200 [Caldilinea sp. CFX5]|nr:hypothetical protein [Caldilinea sp. CFX5]
MSLTLHPTNLAPIVAQALGKPVITLTEWRAQPLAAGGSQMVGGLGIQRVTGVAQTAEGMLPWSLILKALQGGGALASDDPGAWNYWQREAFAYQSGLLAQLPGGIVAPRCYAVQAQADGSFWLWLEEIQSSAKPWTLADHALAARHLGQFNGAYLAGHPLPPAQPWMTWGRTRQWVDFTRPYVERSAQWAATPIGRRWLGRVGLARVHKLWSQTERLLHAFERLPVCYCHHDAFCRNLLPRTNHDGQRETVAIDWALTGYGRIGEEVGVTIAVALEFLDVAIDQARNFDQAVFAGYLDGLRDAGWRGDARLARLGCTTNALIVTGLMWNLFFLEQLQQPTGRDLLTGMIKRPFDDIVAHYAELFVFLFDLGDEALALLDTIR